MRLSSIGIGAAAVAMIAASLGLTWQIVSDDETAVAAVDAASSTATTTTHEGDDHAGADAAAAMDMDAHVDADGSHTHGVDAYPDRVASATEQERAGADSLLAEVETSLARYVDVESAVADGFVAPVEPQGSMYHYRSRANIVDDVALDPDRPEGLVYFVRDDGAEPLLVGALFVARPGQDAPAPGGPITQWHTHDESCGSFVIDAAHPCSTSGRMFHVWIADAVVDAFGVTSGVAFGRA